MKVLIPLTNRGISTASNDNVLIEDKNVFIMDNHRLALWCWFQKMKKGSRYNLLHIDAHPDLSESALPYFKHDLWTMSLDDYRNTWQADINAPLFRWDNYIEVFLKNYPEQIGKTFSATHKIGSDKSLSEEIKPYDLPEFTSGHFSGSKFLNDLPWIVNLDLDYFFSARPSKIEIFSDDYIKSLSESIQLGLKNGMIQILTISLSPECCGSWENAEMMLKKLGFSLN